jgi:hypothetical protein
MSTQTQSFLSCDSPLVGRFKFGHAVLGWPIHSGYDVVRILVATVLLIAAGLKCHQLATEPIIEKCWLDARWLLMFTVEFELLFGIWLLANILPRLSWLAALTCFSLFTCVSLYKALSGYAIRQPLGRGRMGGIRRSCFSWGMNGGQ